MQGFRQFLLSELETVGIPFTANNKNYVIKFVPEQLNDYFGYAPIGGTIYKILWYPEQQETPGAKPDDKFNRTGGNSFTEVKALLREVESQVRQFAGTYKPHGFAWMGNDPVLVQLWDRLGKRLEQIGYFKSKTKNVYLRQDIYDRAHQVDPNEI